MSTTTPDIGVAVVLAATLDWTLREPPAGAHPVSVFGDVVDAIVAREFPAPALSGAVVALTLPLGAALVVALPVWLLDARWPILAAVLAGVVLWTTTSLRLLLDAGREVIERSDDDLAGARAALPALVGRDPEALSPELARSAAVESLAENLSDGLVAPLLAFVLFALVSLPAAVAAAAFVKAVNTLDSMLGYPGPFGTASARLDDAVMFVPARISAVLLGLVAGDPEAPWRARRYASLPASPNAGWPMGTLAAALDVRLERPGSYVLNDVADSPTVADGRRALRATRRAGIAAYALVALVGVGLWL